MNTVDYILNNLDPLTILRHYGFRHIVETDDQIRACCEIHNGNNPTAFVWNKQNNLWFCYTGDCYGGDVFTLVQKMDNVNFTSAVEKAADILGLDVSGMTITQQPNHIINEQKKWIELQRIKSFSNKSVKEYSLPHTRYYETDEKFNRFSPDTLKYYDAKFCKLYPIDESMLYNKLVIPIKRKNQCVGVALRDTTGKHLPKWFYQPKDFKVGSVLYNHDTIIKSLNEITEVILVEGIFDVWAYHEIGIDNVVAIFGSSIKDEQYKMLLKLPLNIVLSFDNDKAGTKCTQSAIKLFKNKTKLYKIDLPPEHDPADCSQQQLMEAYLNRKEPTEKRLVVG